MSYSSLLNLHSRDLKSEAEVETRLLAPLFHDLGYPLTSVIPKAQLQPLIASSGTRKFTVEADFLLLGSNGKAKVIVEAKKSGESVQDAWNQAASYALSYNKDKSEGEKIRLILISNGHVTSLYKHDSNNAVVTLQLSDIASGSPPYTTLRSYVKYMSVADAPSGGLPFEVTLPDELNGLFAKSHDLIWKKEKLAPTDAFFEFCKFIFLKIREDKKREQSGSTLQPYELPMTIGWLDANKATSKHPVRDILFTKLRADLETDIKKGKKRIFDVGENFNLSAETTRELIKKFQHINLSSIDEDLNGRMFEVFLNVAVRGRALGQYFTPRPLVDFMTRIALRLHSNIAEPPIAIDACCGTAGFLIEIMAYLLAVLRNDRRFTGTEKEALERKIKNECLFGVEANARVSHIARINMYLHGDGGSHIFHGDGLDNQPQVLDDMTDERKDEVEDHIKKIRLGMFDIALSNPPFSMTYAEANSDEEKILRQLSVADGSKSLKSNVLFLQRYCDLLKPGGQMLIVIDDTVLNGLTNKAVRVWLLKEFVVLGVHSMPFNAFFKAKANVKTSVLHVRKKTSPEEAQGHVFMSISNNIGHDNALRDTPERNNLNDILNTFFQWQDTGVFSPFVKFNHDDTENLECPAQVWLVEPQALTSERLDAFFYAPELLDTWTELQAKANDGIIKLKRGGEFHLRPKVSRKVRQGIIKEGVNLKYIEIGDVTRYGLITKYITGTLDELPTRAEHQIETGDILMAINNSSRGTVVLVPEEFHGAFCTSGFYVIKPRDEEEGHLLWYALRSEQCRKQIYYLAQTASQPELKLQAWRELFTIPIPTGQEREDAISKSIAFHESLKAIINADDFRYS